MSAVSDASRFCQGQTFIARRRGKKIILTLAEERIAVALVSGGDGNPARRLAQSRATGRALQRSDVRAPAEKNVRSCLLLQNILLLLYFIYYILR